MVINANDVSVETQDLDIVKNTTQYYKVKTRNLSDKRYDLVLELKTKDDNDLVKAVSAINGLTNVSLVAFDGENFA
jgi:hypothetical protein